MIHKSKTCFIHVHGSSLNVISKITTRNLFWYCNLSPKFFIIYFSVKLVWRSVFLTSVTVSQQMWFVSKCEDVHLENLIQDCNSKKWHLPVLRVFILYEVLFFTFFVDQFFLCLFIMVLKLQFIYFVTYLLLFLILLLLVTYLSQNVSIYRQRYMVF